MELVVRENIGRTTRMSLYSAGDEIPRMLNGTWVEAEAFAYPRGGFTRRAYVELRCNPHNTVKLPYGARYMVRCAIADTYYTIPARFRFRKIIIQGFISITDAGNDLTARFTFTPEAE